MDARIGKRGGDAPTVCAISEQPLKKPYVTHSLGGDFFCRVIANYDRFWSEKVATQLKAIANGSKSQAVIVEKEESK